MQKDNTAQHDGPSDPSDEHLIAQEAGPCTSPDENLAGQSDKPSDLSDEDFSDKRAAVMCIGNVLLLDEGVGPAVAKELLDRFEWPDNVDVLDSGTMGFALVGDLSEYDYVLTVDAVDGTGAEPGTVFSYRPEDMEDNIVSHGAHDTRFIEVLEACDLLGFRPVGECIGIQIENMSPEQLIIGLTPKVYDALPLACETVLATLYRHGIRGIIDRSTGKEVGPDRA